MLNLLIDVFGALYPETGMILIFYISNYSIKLILFYISFHFNIKEEALQVPEHTD
jgi:hypothetical protein